MPSARSPRPSGPANGALRLGIQLARASLLCAALALLPGCPEERPGAAKEIPSQRIPPAMSLEPPPPTGSVPGAGSPHSIATPSPSGTAAPGTVPRKGSTAQPPSPGRTDPRP